jgi:hypothetical protein
MTSVNFINFSQFLRVILPPAVKDESPCIAAMYTADQNHSFGKKIATKL